jgi:hypothetical protein
MSQPTEDVKQTTTMVAVDQSLVSTGRRDIKEDLQQEKRQRGML